MQATKVTMVEELLPDLTIVVNHPQMDCNDGILRLRIQDITHDVHFCLRHNWTHDQLQVFDLKALAGFIARFMEKQYADKHGSQAEIICVKFNTLKGGEDFIRTRKTWTDACIELHFNSIDTSKPHVEIRTVLGMHMLLNVSGVDPDDVDVVQLQEVCQPSEYIRFHPGYPRSSQMDANERMVM